MLNIKIPMPGLSLNHSHLTTKSGKRIKKAETRNYEDSFIKYINCNIFLIKTFLQDFNPKVNVFVAKYIFFFSEDQYFTKKKAVNLRISDVDNMIKITQDNLFKVFNINDGFVKSAQSIGLPCEGQAHIIISIKISTVDQLLKECLNG